MITKIITGIVAFVWVLGWVILIVEICRSEYGYQDDKGFHIGKDPHS